MPHPLPEGIEGVRRLIAAAKNDRERSLIVLCGLVGCRVGEAISVRSSHFDLDDMLLKIRGKGDKERIVPVSEEAWTYLSGPVLLSMLEDDRPVVNMLDRGARAVITKLGVKCELQRHISSHDLRATFATAVYEKTMDIRLVQRLLGHSNLKTTEGYVKRRLDQMRGAVAL